MISKVDYYLIVNSTTDVCDISNEQYERALGTWLCPTCSTPKPPRRQISITLNYLPSKPPLTMVNRCRLGIVRRDFLSLFVEPTTEEMLIGRVELEGVGFCPDWLTYQTKMRVIVRGSKNAGYRHCEECKAIHYFAQGKRYLFPRPDPSTRILQEHGGSLIVRADAFPNLKPKDWPGLLFRKLQVLDEPLDGFGVLENT